MHIEQIQQKATLQWSEPRPPNGESHYDHIVAEYPLGQYMIEWKSWQRATGYDLVLNFNRVGTYPTLEEAKVQAVEHVRKIAKQLQEYCA